MEVTWSTSLLLLDYGHHPTTQSLLRLLWLLARSDIVSNFVLYNLKNACCCTTFFLKNHNHQISHVPAPLRLLPSIAVQYHHLRIALQLCTSHHMTFHRSALRDNKLHYMVAIYHMTSYTFDRCYTWLHDTSWYLSTCMICIFVPLQIERVAERPEYLPKRSTVLVICHCFH